MTDTDLNRLNEQINAKISEQNIDASPGQNSQTSEQINTGTFENDVIINTPDISEEPFENTVSFGDYQIIRQLGRGGMGEVFLAVHKLMKRQVAVKVIKHDKIGDQQAIQRFCSEIKTISLLRHPHIVQAYDAGQIDGFFFLVMEYLKGNNLNNAVKQNGMLSLETACNYIIQTAEGLLFTHKQRIIHRDVKPENVWLEKNGNIKILDLGLAKYTNLKIDTDNDFNSTDFSLSESMISHNVAGTPDFMSPEQFVFGIQIDKRTDIYSLGCVFFFLLTGFRPFALDKSQSINKQIQKRIESPVPSIRKYRKDIPRAVQVVLDKMMASQRDDRYNSMSEVIAVLTPYAEKSVLNYPLDVLGIRRKSKSFFRSIGICFLVFLCLIFGILMDKIAMRTTTIPSTPSTTPNTVPADSSTDADNPIAEPVKQDYTDKNINTDSSESIEHPSANPVIPENIQTPITETSQSTVAETSASNTNLLQAKIPLPDQPSIIPLKEMALSQAPVSFRKNIDKLRQKISRESFCVAGQVLYDDHGVLRPATKCFFSVDIKKKPDDVTGTYRYSDGWFNSLVTSSSPNALIITDFQYGKFEQQIPLEAGKINFFQVILKPLPDDMRTAFSGRIIDENGKPFANVPISLVLPTKNVNYPPVENMCGQTDEKGFYSFPGIARLNYLLSIDVSGAHYTVTDVKENMEVVVPWKYEFFIDYVYSKTNDFTGKAIQRNCAIDSKNRILFRTGEYGSTGSDVYFRSKNELGVSARSQIYSLGNIPFDSVNNVTGEKSLRGKISFAPNQVFTVRTLDGGFAKFMIREIKAVKLDGSPATVNSTKSINASDLASASDATVLAASSEPANIALKQEEKQKSYVIPLSEEQLSQAPPEFLAFYSKLKESVTGTENFHVGGQIFYDDDGVLKPANVKDFSVALKMDCANALDTYRYENGWFINPQNRDISYDILLVVDFRYGRLEQHVPIKEGQINLFQVVLKKPPQEKLSTFTGHIVDEQGDNIADAKVSVSIYISNGYSQPLAKREVQTDENGNFSIPDIIWQAYIIDIEKKGFADGYIKVSDIDDKLHKEITLKRLRTYVMDYVYSEDNDFTNDQVHHSINLKLYNRFYFKTGAKGIMHSNKYDLFLVDIDHFRNGVGSGIYCDYNLDFDKIEKVDEDSLCRRLDSIEKMKPYCMKTGQGNYVKFIIREIMIQY